MTQFLRPPYSQISSQQFTIVPFHFTMAEVHTLTTIDKFSQLSFFSLFQWSLFASKVSTMNLLPIDIKSATNLFFNIHHDNNLSAP